MAPRLARVGTSRFGTIVAAALPVMAALSAVAPGPAAAGPVLPDFSAANFTPGAPINNPYFPLAPGTTFRASAQITDPESGEKGFEVDEDVVTSKTRVIAGVTARVVHARGFLDGVLVEDTDDFYARDKSGNVWYMGESTRAFEYDAAGKSIGTSTEGSWMAGVHGGKPGYIMPAHPTVGFSYYQEFAPADQAVDQAKIVSVNGTLTGPLGHFTHVVKTVESTAVEPGVLENKYYAPGLGVVLTEEDLNAAGQPLSSIPLRSVTTALPLPPGLWPGCAVLFASILVTATMRRRVQARQ